MEEKNGQTGWVSSLDIIEKTGISRATLNNYIKMNILPRPNVKKPEEAAVRARMLGYFPESVIDTIGQIKMMKKQGYTMDVMIERLKRPDLIKSSGEALMPEERKDPLADLFPGRKKKISDLLRQRMPTLISYCVLVADLQNSVRICAELPPEEYLELINQIWGCVEGSFKQYYDSTRGKHAGEGMLYYFIKERDNQYMMNAVSCALEIRENVKKLNMEWKMRKGWFNELYLNIGINEGREYFGTISSASGIEVTSLGDTVNHASRLSDFARYGAIWTTKNLINQLGADQKDGIRYGIRHIDKDREVVVENSFSRIMDMMTPDNVRSSKFMNIATLAVTEILGRQ
jgi:adenylate cyclase